jgi:hypothetical protein
MCKRLKGKNCEDGKECDIWRFWPMTEQECEQLDLVLEVRAVR